jgi:sulfatase maturation enzyme AslB (radical SAM superfamily)
MKLETDWEKIDNYLFLYKYKKNQYLIQTYPFRVLSLNQKTSDNEDLRKIAKKLPSQSNIVDPGKYYLPLFIGTTSCNFQCKYCYAYQGSYGERSLMISDAIIEKTVNFLGKKMAALSKKSTKKEIEFALVFFGGEALMNFSGIQYLVKKMKQVTSQLNADSKTKFKPLIIINTNGSLFTDRVLDYLEAN